MVYKPHYRTPLELLSTAGLQAYLLPRCLLGLLGHLRAWILAHGGFLVVFRPWVPSRRHFFSLYLLLLFLFFSQFLVLFSALFIFFCFVLYFLILFAFSFRKIINFLLVPFVFKFENTFFVFCFLSCFIYFILYLLTTKYFVAIFNYYEGRAIRH